MKISRRDAPPLEPGAVSQTVGIIRCPGIVFEEAFHPEPFRMPRHSHDRAHMVLLFAGAIENVSGPRTTTATATDLLFVPAGETHSSQYRDRVHGFYVHFNALWWERMQASMRAIETTRPFHSCPAAWLARRMYREFLRRDNLTPLMLEGMTLELLVTMAREVSGEVASETCPPRWLRQVRERLHAHYAEGLELDVLAREEGVHPGHLMRSFRQRYHCTIGEYVRQLRVERACRLLTDGGESPSLTEIAHVLGFADQSHFCKTFKEITGMTPTEMRNRAQNVRPIQIPRP